MGITRQGPVKNMDTDQELVMLPPNQRMTRSSLHRLLLINDIEHDASGPFNDLYNTVMRHGIDPIPPKPGPLTSTKGEAIGRTGGDVIDNVTYIPKPDPKLHEDGFPRSVFSLRKMCRDRKIPCTQKDTRIMLVDKLIRYLSG